MDHSKPKAIITSRRAEFDDTKGLLQLVDSCGGTSMFKAAFGQFNFPTLIENSYLSLVVTEGHVNETGNIEENYVSVMSINDNISISAESESFGTTVKLLKTFIPIHENNTLFINFFALEDISNSKYGTGNELINRAFSLCPHIDFLVWICPVSYMTSDFIDRTFASINMSDLQKSEGSTGVFKGMKVLFLHRANFLPKLMVREARVEDNDDLIPILRKFNPDILVGQENFFLADLISNQDEQNKFFVGLRRNHIMGMLATSLDVNVSLITKLFDISAFDNIIIQEEEKPLPPPLVINLVGDLRLVDITSLEEVVYGLDCIFVNSETIAANGGGGSAESKSDDITPLTAHFNLLLTKRKAENIPPPSAFIVYGYPRSESEAIDHVAGVIRDCQYIIELHNTAEDAEEDDEDIFIQRHLDGLEILREQYFKGDKGNNNNNSGLPRAFWKKISIDSELHDKSDNLGVVAGEVGKLLEARNMRIEAQRARDSEQPPMANAFALTVFCMEDEFLSRAEDLLKVAFEDHPSHDYCLYMVPNNRPPSALTQAMTYVKTRPGLSFDQSLYLMHRSYFLAHEHIKVNRVLSSTLDRLEQFISLIPRESERKVLLEVVQSSLVESDVDLRDNPAEVSFMVEIGQTVIGVIQLTRKILTNDDSNWFRANYKIDSLISFDRHRVRSQAIITQFVLDPIYSKWTRFILREIMRLYNKTLLYFHSERDVVPPKEILEDFVYLNPRSRMQTPVEEKINIKVDLLSRPSPNCLASDCPLYLMTKYFLSKPKDIVAKRVVLIGGSPHSYAFLETLLSIPDILLPNIYLVMERLPPPLRLNTAAGVSDFGSTTSGEESKFDDDYAGCLTPNDVDFPLENELYAMGFAHKVNIIRGHLTDIDRENKAVVVSGEVAIEYDILILSSNTQDNTAKRLPSVKSMHSAKCADAGIFELGNPSGDLLAVRWIRKRYNTNNNAKADSAIVVYGTVIRALTAVARLLKSGIAANRVIAVVHDEPNFINEIEDSAIADKLVQTLTLLQIRIYWEHTVNDITLSRSGFLSSVDLKPRHGKDVPQTDPNFEITDDGCLRVPCIALLTCNYKQCDRDVFAAVNDSGLVFDGGLVVDASFCTVDHSIYGVSDYTRFSRMYKEAIPHVRYNPREVGAYVALKVLSHHLDPQSSRLHRPHTNGSGGSVMSGGHNSRQGSRPGTSSVHNEDGSVNQKTRLTVGIQPHHKLQALPVFSLPRSVYTELPGDMYYFQSTTPKQPDEASFLTTPLPVNVSSRASIIPATDGVSVCALKVDHFGNVAEFVYLGTHRVEERNLRHIPGKHEAFLNTAVHAHKKGFVSDWIQHFREEWACALYHDKFPNLIKSLREALSTDKGMVLILSRVFERAENTSDNQEIDDYRRNMTGPHCELLPEVTAKSIQAETTTFLRENRSTLSQYYLPEKNNTTGQHLNN